MSSADLTSGRRSAKKNEDNKPGRAERVLATATWAGMACLVAIVLWAVAAVYG